MALFPFFRGRRCCCITTQLIKNLRLKWLAIRISGATLNDDSGTCRALDIVTRVQFSNHVISSVVADDK